MTAIASSLLAHCPATGPAATERKLINRMLKIWGNWVEHQLQFQGFASENILEAAKAGGRSAMGHRILCLEMPRVVRLAHSRVQRLPRHEHDAVWLWYVPVMQENGRVRPISLRCQLAGIAEETLRKRVYRARKRIAGF